MSSAELLELGPSRGAKDPTLRGGVAKPGHVG